ncbi:PadR family transcriptional regulator [Paludibaculum fermentans]|uniref:PadR family transcriptional regulator n=1 Tax=Paludibaculum fermentans TaxID=1473598 RepID=A0A7S7SIV4_PALFE|nr:PadR family transcriptional regulator [Paludibaculum fermentans]
MAQNDDLLPGTLDVLVLQILSGGTLHGWGIAQRLKLLSRDVLSVQQGSLYPALHKMEGEGWISAEWKATDEGRQAKFYALTARGRKQLAEARARWVRLSSAVGLVLDIAQD